MSRSIRNVAALCRLAAALAGERASMACPASVAGVSASEAVGSVQGLGWAAGQRAPVEEGAQAQPGRRPAFLSRDPRISPLLCPSHLVQAQARPVVTAAAAGAAAGGTMMKVGCSPLQRRMCRCCKPPYLTLFFVPCLNASLVCLSLRSWEWTCPMHMSLAQARENDMIVKEAGRGRSCLLMAGLSGGAPGPSLLCVLSTPLRLPEFTAALAVGFGAYACECGRGMSSSLGPTCKAPPAARCQDFVGAGP